jgi:hypothetical protein
MTYFSSQANTNDFSGMCYPLPLYQYGMDYGTGYYYNNGYGYPGSCYPVTSFPTMTTTMSPPRPKKSYTQV